MRVIRVGARKGCLATPTMQWHSSTLVRGERQAHMPATPGRKAEAVLGTPSVLFSLEFNSKLNQWIIMTPMTMALRVAREGGP